MSTIALPHAHQQSRALRRSHPLVAVIAWELRRYRASRLFWLQALGFFGIVLLVTWASQMPSQFNLGNGSTVTSIGFVAGTSAWGLLMTLPTGVLLLLCLLLPFVNADGVSRDLSTPHPRTADDDAAADLGLCLGTLPGWPADEPGAGPPAAGCVILGMGVLLHLTNTDVPRAGAGSRCCCSGSAWW